MTLRFVNLKLSNEYLIGDQIVFKACEIELFNLETL